MFGSPLQIHRMIALTANPSVHSPCSMGRENLWKQKEFKQIILKLRQTFFFLINQEKKSYQTTPKQGALPKYTGSIQRRPHPRQQRRNKNLEKPKITNKSTTQHIHKREIVHVHELLRPFKKSPKEEILQARIWLLFFLEHYSIPLSPNTPKQTNRRHFPNYTPLLF